MANVPTCGHERAAFQLEGARLLQALRTVRMGRTLYTVGHVDEPPPVALVAAPNV
jgi:hypothetical protein